MVYETILAVFDAPAAADAAVAELRAAQVLEASIERRGLSDGAGFVEDHGLWDSVFGDVTHATDKARYDMQADPGISVVSVRDVPAHDVDAVSALLRRHGPVRVERRGDV